ncbi:hypothetical protein KIN20_001139 [Parelaphostrongylus tenuis]|uniref:DUF7627 domain-containing protein n=1 Tax=Parelaphostrongylus tenuis TaxID=148309 RepID=A0AAD5LWK4_PARTN|nr:hypothetical protein KIN20_001139 [Parelaphostrongylus tenuis]
MPRAARTEDAESSRDRRLFATIQSTLNEGRLSSSNQNSRTGRPKEKISGTVEELNDLDSVIAQIVDLNIRADRSAMQIKKNIAECGFLSQMTEDDWSAMCKSLICTAINDGEMDFVVDLFIPLMEYDVFCEDIGNIPALLSAILCASWPRHMSKAIDTINPILYTSISIIKGWLLVLEEDNEAQRKADNSSPIQDRKEDDSSPTEQEREDPEVVNRCAHSVCLLCESAQRSLWMKWPELCDEMYSVIKPSITHNQVITGDVKAGLLHTMMMLSAWTRAKVVTMKNAQTQTVRPSTS